MGIVQLAKEGQLRVDDEVAKYIPELKVYEGVTIREKTPNARAQNWTKRCIFECNMLLTLLFKNRT